LWPLAFAAWASIVIVTAWHHEFWRDEVRAFSIAIAAPSVLDLPTYLRDEGHPLLWYALLHGAYGLTHGAWVLPVIAGLIAAAAVLLWLYRAPFSLSLKLLFVFSVLPLYEYAVMARNYGIGMLLMFAFAALYPRRRQHRIALALLLAALANSNVPSLILAALLTGLWFWDEVIADRGALTPRDGWALALCGGLIAVAAVGAVLTVLPDNDTIVTPVARPSILSALARAITHPWESLHLILPFSWGMVPDSLDHALKDALILGLLIGLAARPLLAVVLSGAIIAFGLLFQLVYGGAVRHQGLLLVFALTLYWLMLDGHAPQSSALRWRAQQLALWLVWPAILLWADYQAVQSVSTDLRYEVSSVKSLAGWIGARPQYRSGVIMAEPDWVIEALPYYSALPMFIPREGRFARWTHLTRAAANTFSLDQLLDVAEAVRRQHGGPLLIALGPTVEDFESGRAPPASYGRSLQWTPTQWQRFRNETVPLAMFRSAIYDENFDLYELR
jgi:hypothetical protein